MDARTPGLCSARRGIGLPVWAAVLGAALAATSLAAVLVLNVNVAGAAGPLVEHAQKLAGTGWTAESRFGGSLALSEDDSTALVGAPHDGYFKGAAFVFVHTAAGWVQQGPKLTASEPASGEQVGTSVALSEDGDTALVGADARAVYVFTRSGATWSLSQKLEGSFGFGVSVALSADGHTALIGDPYEDEYEGSAYVYSDAGGTWAQVGEKLTASGTHPKGYFGSAMALSADGSTAVVNGGGSGWVFGRTGEATWTAQGTLTPAPEGVKPPCCAGVATSANGSTVLIGDGASEDGTGAAWAFVRSGEAWSQQGPKITEAGELSPEWFGEAISLSADGNTALIGAPEHFVNGSAWVLHRSGETWSEQTGPLVGTGEITGAEFGASVALSADGTSALIGGYREFGETNEFNGERGAVWAGSIAALTRKAPEIGRCVKTKEVNGGGVYGYHAHFTTAKCTLESSSGRGEYEWYAGPHGAKARFTNAFVGGTHKILFETVGRKTIECSHESGTGEYSDGHALAAVTFTFGNCAGVSGGLAGKCTSPGDAEGELTTASLEGVLGWEQPSQVAIDLFPADGAATFAEFTCGATSVVIRGSVIAPIASGKAVSSTPLTFAVSKGHQKIEHLEGAGDDVLEMSVGGGPYEQGGLGLNAIQHDEEALEINPAY